MNEVDDIANQVVTEKTQMINHGNLATYENGENMNSDVKQSNEEIDENYEEGELYIVKKGELEHIPRDSGDNLKKIRITNDAYDTLLGVQKQMRKTLNGYKPDVTIVCSALIKQAASAPDQASIAVKQYVKEIFS